MSTTTIISTGPAARTHLSPGQRGALVLEVLIAYGHVRRYMRTLTLPETVSRLRAAPHSRRELPLSDPRLQGRRLGHVITRTLAVVPAPTACLIRSLVMLRMLAVRGINGELVIAALPSETKPLDAHAWVELDGRPLLPPEPAFGRLLTL